MVFGKESQHISFSCGIFATSNFTQSERSLKCLQEEASPVVSSLRAWMQKENMDCFIVPSDDPHLRYGKGRASTHNLLRICVIEVSTVEPCSKFKSSRKLPTRCCFARAIVVLVFFFPCRFPKFLRSLSPSLFRSIFSKCFTARFDAAVLPASQRVRLRVLQSEGFFVRLHWVGRDCCDPQG